MKTYGVCKCCGKTLGTQFGLMWNLGPEGELLCFRCWAWWNELFYCRSREEEES